MDTINTSIFAGEETKPERGPLPVQTHELNGFNPDGLTPEPGH